MIGLPDIEEPAIAFITQPLYLFAKLNRTLDGGVDEAFTGVAFHHCRGGFCGGDNAVMRRCGGMHHVIFIEGRFINVALHMNHRGLGKRSQ